jgi:pimeloyl-ACP methyl ester carboxylesterase
MRANNIEFNIKIKGEGETLLWGHGLTASIRSEDLLGIFEWEKFPMDHKLVRYDARGHGKTEPSFSPSDYHWENMSRDMLAIADKLKIEKFIAGGQSMGCATTIYSGLNYPDRLKGMILMNPPTAWETRATQGAYYRKLSKIGWLLGGGILSKVMAKNPERLLPGWLVDEIKDKVSGALEGIKPMKRRTLSNLFKGAALTDLPSREEIKSIDIPTLILGWTQDPTHPVETAEELDRLLPNSTLVIAENYSDFSNWPQLIRDFVKNTV